MLERLSVFILAALMMGILYTVFVHDFTFELRDEKAEDTPDFIFKDIVVSHFNDGKLELEVSTNRAVIYRDSQELVMDGAQGVSTFDQDHFIRFNSNQGILNLMSQSLLLNEAYLVYASLDDYLWVYSKELTWNTVDNYIQSSQESFLHNKTMRIRSRFFHYDVNQHVLELNKNPTIEVNINES